MVKFHAGVRSSMFRSRTGECKCPGHSGVVNSPWCNFVNVSLRSGCLSSGLRGLDVVLNPGDLGGEPVAILPTNRALSPQCSDLFRPELDATVLRGRTNDRTDNINTEVVVKHMYMHTPPRTHRVTIHTQDRRTAATKLTSGCFGHSVGSIMTSPAPANHAKVIQQN